MKNKSFGENKPFGLLILKRLWLSVPRGWSPVFCLWSACATCVLAIHFTAWPPYKDSGRTEGMIGHALI